jgi:hypothetical protein
VLYYFLIYISSMCFVSLLTICFKWILFGHVRPGLYQDDEWTRWRRWWLDLLTRVSFNWMAFWDKTHADVIWLKLMGAKIMRSVFLNPTMCVAAYDADLVRTEDDETFFSNARIICDMPVRERAGWRRRGEVILGASSSVGFGVIVEGGSRVGAHSAVGAAAYLPMAQCWEIH